MDLTHRTVVDTTHPPIPFGTSARFVIRDGVIYTSEEKVYVPNNRTIKTRIMHECHDATMSGHLGTAKTLERCTRSFYWPRMHDEVRTYVQSCMACRQQTQQSTPSRSVAILTDSRPSLQQVTMDLITQLPKTERGYDAVVVFVDKLSKMIHIAPAHTTVSAPDLARIMIHEVVRLHGVPESIVSDRDLRFTSMFWRSLWSHFGTQLKMSTAYHPQTDGQTERANRTIEDMRRNYVSWEQDDWDQNLTCEFAYNNSVQASTGCTPFYLYSGQHPLSPVDHVVSTRGSALDSSCPSNPASESFVQRINGDPTSKNESTSSTRKTSQVCKPTST